MKHPTDEAVDALLSNLNQIAQDVCHYEYGLPLFTDSSVEAMRKAVYAFFNKHANAKPFRDQASVLSFDGAGKVQVDPETYRASSKVQAQVQAVKELMKVQQCPKCEASSGDAWTQCKGSCPMPFSPHYDESSAQQ